MGNRFIIALQSTPLRFLATPLQTLQQIPDAARAIAYVKQNPDQMRDAIQRPIIFRIAGGIRPAREGTRQAPQLGGGQAAGVSRSTATALAFGLFGLLLPTAHTPFRRTDPFGNLLGALTASQQLQRTLTATCKLFGCSERSHVPNYRTSLTYADINF
jgi:hypothetical protein